jgi:hypothetical protein
LAGAAAAAVAIAQPVLHSQRPSRLLGVGVCPSAELAGVPGGPAAPAIELLRRLAPADRVQLLLPDVLGALPPPLPPEQAIQRLGSLPLLPAKAAELGLPQPPAELQHIYIFGAVGLTPSAGPRTTIITLPAQPGELTIDAFAIAAPPPAPSPASTSPTGARQLEALVAVRNHAAQPRRGQLALAQEGRQIAALPYDLPPGGRAVLTAPLENAGQWFSAAIQDAAGYGAAAFLAARREPAARVALLGRDDPHVRRFLQLCPGFKLQPDASKADAVIAVGVDPASPPLSQRDIPALCVDPSSPPPAWQAGPALGPLSLRQAAHLEHPLLANVDLSGVAVRTLATWQTQAASPPQQVLASVQGQAFLLIQQQPRRIYLSLDISADNTNFAVTEPAFVIFLANAMQYLLPGGPGRQTFSAMTPLQLGPNPDVMPIIAPAARSRPAPLAPPGVYRRADGSLVAVSLTGLASAQPPAALPSPSSLPLPPPTYHAAQWPLAPALAVLALLLWLSGWLLRAR